MLRNKKLGTLADKHARQASTEEESKVEKKSNKSKGKKNDKI